MQSVGYHLLKIMKPFVIEEICGDLNSEGENFFHDICRHGCVSLLLRAGLLLDQTTPSLLREYNYQGKQWVHIVAANHRGQDAVRLMEVFMELGADLNEPDRSSGSTMLHIAVYYQDYELVTWVMSADHRGHGSSQGELTAYQVAWKRDDFKMMDIFFKFDADCDQPYSSSESESENEMLKKLLFVNSYKEFKDI